MDRDNAHTRKNFHSNCTNCVVLEKEIQEKEALIKALKEVSDLQRRVNGELREAYMGYLKEGVDNSL